MRVLKALCCAVAIVGCLAPAARADEWNKKTYLTFSGPVQIPGATLPAGTYLFQLADPDTARHVVMVASKDGTKVYGMFLTIPNDRLDTPDENIVMFGESPAGTPQAIQAWWYPGDRTGEEFVYPRSQATQIAKANHREVLATEGEVNANGSESERMGTLRGSKVVRRHEPPSIREVNANGSESERMGTLRGSKVARVDEHGNVSGEPAATNTAESVKQAQRPATTTAQAAPAPANTVNGRDVNSAKANTAPTTTTASARRNTANNAVGTSGAQRRSTLPQTASELSAIELLSGLFLAAGVALRLARRRFALAR